MKIKNLIFAIMFLISSPTFASGLYDGIWALFPYGYITLTERENVLIAVVLATDDDDGGWEAYQGPRNGNTARLNTIFGNAQVTVDVNFESDTTMKATIVSCRPNPDYYCLFPAGTVLNINKVW